MTFKPLHDRVVVRRVENDEKTSGGLIIPDSAQEKPAEGEVVSVGTGIFSQNGERIPMTVKIGDKVMYTKDMGGDEITMGDDKYWLFNEHQLLGILN